MGKRKLTKQQRWRVDKIQDERKARAQKRNQHGDELLLSGKLGPEQAGLVISHYGVQADVEALEGALKGQVQRCHIRTNMEALVTGDRVVWCPGEPTGVVVATEPRRSVLMRPDNYNHLKPVAANIDHIIIVIAPEPQPFTNLIDRYLVAAHASNIEPILLLNKADTITDMAAFLTQHGFAVYRQLGYTWLTASTKVRDGLGTLKAFLHNKTSVFVGQSGVGKSSLINALLPNTNTAVGELSGIGKGSHTTSAARLFHLPNDVSPETGSLIDSPGIREFGLWHLEAEQLLSYFAECRPLIGTCKFRDCTHTNEPQCAMLKAIRAGKITQQRFDSYRLIKQTLDDHQAARYD
jgi:ribosome biogenesis GTPase